MGGIGAKRFAAIDPSLRASWPLWLAFACLAAPTMVTLGNQVWSRESGAHGPIVLCTGAWLLWRQFPEFRAKGQAGSPWLTALMLIPSLALYVFGRAYDFISLETAGLYGVGISILHALIGLPLMLRNWFPLLYLGFVVPPPQWLLDKITGPLKQFVSYAATEPLQAAGIPLAREGVTIFVAQYQLLVEDACSGMNSLIGLIAISLLYIYLMRGSSWVYAVFLTAMVIPIAIVANILRIVILIVLTYAFGDDVAQGFSHFAAGLVLFATALLLVFAIDRLIFHFVGRRTKTA